MAQTSTRRGRSAKSALSEEAVVDAGLRVLQRSGIEAVTMRAVGQELDTGAASLYVYVSGRDALLRLMFDRVAGQIDYPKAIDPRRWREQLRALCLSMLETLDAHPGIAGVALGSVPLGANGLDGAEAMMALLLAGGLEPERAAWASDALFLLVVATAVESVVRVDEGRMLSGATGKILDADAISGVFGGLPPDRYPSLVEHHDVLASGEGRDRFLFAVDTFLAGVVPPGAAD